MFSIKDVKTQKAVRDLRQALAKARERRLEERISIAQLLKQAGSKNTHFGEHTLALYNQLLTMQR